MNKINSRKEVIMKFLVYNIHRIIKENKNIINYFLKRISTRLKLCINLNTLFLYCLTMEKAQAPKESQKVKDSLINESVIGRDAIVFLMNNQMEMGKLTDFSKYEIEITKKDGTKRIIFKSGILTIEFR
jgi:sRNA-binding regulator protein Hfq